MWFRQGYEGIVRFGPASKSRKAEFFFEAIVDDLTTTFGPSPLLAFQSVPTVVSCFFIAVLARLRHFRRIHDCANRQPPN